MKAISFKKFEVVSSDNGESYVWVRREFDTLEDGMKFQERLEKAMESQAKKNVFRLIQNVDDISYAYVPLIKILSEDYYECPYDIDGEPLEGFELMYTEQYVAIFGIYITQKSLFCGSESPCEVNVKMTIGIPVNEFEKKYKSTEVKINIYDYLND